MENHQQLFRQLPETSRVWIYQSARELSPDESQRARTLVKNFVQQWTSHSEKVLADGAVVHNRFVVLVADETSVQLGGCSIDSSVKWIQGLEQQLGITLLDRLTVAYRDGQSIKTADQNTFQQLFENRLVDENTIVFNNLVHTLQEFYTKWETPLCKSWHIRMVSAAARH